MQQRRYREGLKRRNDEQTEADNKANMLEGAVCDSFDDVDFEETPPPSKARKNADDEVDLHENGRNTYAPLLWWKFPMKRLCYDNGFKLGPMIMIIYGGRGGDKLIRRPPLST